MRRVLDQRVAGRPRYIWLPEGDSLPYIPPQLLGCVVFVGYEDSAGKEHFAGTAFWISRPGPEDIKERFRTTYLVTAAHVLENIQKNTSPNYQRIRIRVNAWIGGQRWEDTPLCYWKVHPDPAADIAVFKMPLDQKKVDHFAWPVEAFVNEQSTKEDGGRRIGHGDDVFVAGLFSRHQGKFRNVPIVRMANIAALTGEPIEGCGGLPLQAYLVESRSIGGLSGSPVFYDIYALKEAFIGESRMVTTPIKFRLLGVMHGHFECSDIELDTITEDANKEKRINSGIAIVIPAQRVVEATDLFAEEDAQEAEEYRAKSRSYVVPDSSPVGNRCATRHEQGSTPLLGP